MLSQGYGLSYASIVIWIDGVDMCTSSDKLLCEGIALR
ncbi:hypothetical protein P368_10720 [Comamonas thiooxydans]|nr:hypothetical protein P369_09465 [Comamonas thiooxydans]KGG98561.1 hypothetical protein P367_12370 [Comamonas thiooxydans]KGH04510.1 hypothetical protein P365_12535 [Comamonas thiooxydans]KGH13020.1 hypothetical protein P368_10720 [Comamonas thiooxydans]